jgi:Ca2+-binding EF-hand superfamily protein
MKMSLCLIAAVLGFVSTASAQKHVPSLAFTLDGNRDGVVTLDEFAAVLLARWARADSDGDGNVTTEEFAAARAAIVGALVGRPDLPAQLPGDEDEDGALNRTELEHLVTSMAQRIDADQDAELSAEELSYGMMALRGSLFGPAAKR